MVRAEHNVLRPFPLPSARKRVFIGCMDLSFDFSFSTGTKKKLVGLYSEEPESPPLDCDLFQVDICHDG